MDGWTTKVNLFFAISAASGARSPRASKRLWTRNLGCVNRSTGQPVNLPLIATPLRNQGFYQGLIKGNPWWLRGGMLGGIGWLAMRNGKMLQWIMGYFSGNTHNIRVHFHLRVLFSWISIMSSFDFGLTSCGGDVSQDQLGFLLNIWWSWSMWAVDDISMFRGVLRNAGLAATRSPFVASTTDTKAIFMVR